MSPRTPYRVVFVVWAAIVAPALARRVMVDWRWNLVFEAACYLGLGLVLASCAPLVEAIRRLSAGWRTALVLLVAALLGAQLSAVDRHSYPFARVSMFSENVGDNARAMSWQGVTAAGRRVVIHPDRVLPALSQGRMRSRVNRLRRADTVTGDKTLEGVLRAVGIEWNHQHGGDDLVRVELYSRSLTVEELDRGRPVEVRRVATAWIDGAG